MEETPAIRWCDFVIRTAAHGHRQPGRQSEWPLSAGFGPRRQPTKRQWASAGGIADACKASDLEQPQGQPISVVR